MHAFIVFPFITYILLKFHFRYMFLFRLLSLSQSQYHRKQTIPPVLLYQVLISANDGKTLKI